MSKTVCKLTFLDDGAVRPESIICTTWRWLPSGRTVRSYGLIEELNRIWEKALWERQEA